METDISWEGKIAKLPKLCISFHVAILKIQAPTLALHLGQQELASKGFVSGTAKAKIK